MFPPLYQGGAIGGQVTPELTPNVQTVLVGWVEQNSPIGVQIHVARWKPNDIQDSVRRA